MTRIKTTRISLSVLETVLFTFMLCCPAMAMKKDETKEKSSRLVHKPKVLSSSLPSLPKISDKNTGLTPTSNPSNSKTISFPSSPVLPHKNINSRTPLSRKTSTPNSTSAYVVKEGDSYNPLSPRSSSAPTSPSSSPRTNDARTPLSRTTSVSHSPRTSDSRIPLSRKISVSNPHSPSSLPRDLDSNVTSPTIPNKPEVVISSPLNSQSSNIKKLQRSQSVQTNSQKVPRLDITSASSQGPDDILLSPNRSPNQSPHRTRKLSRQNSHATESGRTVYFPKFFQSIHDNLVDTLDNEMSKFSVLGGMGELQHLRWRFYCALKKNKPIFSPNQDKIIEYIQAIEPKNLLNKFWNIDLTTHLDDDHLISKLSFEDLELIGQSIEFLLDSDLVTDKSFLYHSALRCYHALVKHKDKNDQENTYDYEVTKYATLTEDYTLASSHFLECINSNKLQLEHDAIWINPLANGLLLDLEHHKKSKADELDRPQCLFNIARLKNNMNQLVKADKPHYMPSPPTPEQSKMIKSGELIFFYDKVLYVQFFDKPKMELDLEAMNFFLENEKMQDDSSSSSEIFSMDTETISNQYKLSDLIKYIKKTVKGAIPRFIDGSSIQEEGRGIQPNEIILSYETVPCCQVFGKDKIQIHFDAPSSQRISLTSNCFAKLMETLHNRDNIQGYQSMTEEWNQFIGSIPDGYNLVLNENMEHMEESDPEVTNLYLKSALLYYQGKDPWNSMKKWGPHILFSIAQASLHKIQEKNNSKDESIEKFYYDLIKFISKNNKNNYKKYYFDIIQTLLNVPMQPSTFRVKRGEHFAEMGKIASDMNDQESAHKLYFEAANIFYEIKYRIESYKKLEYDMIAVVLSHALEQKDKVHEDNIIKELSFYLAKTEDNRKKHGSSFYEQILNYFYNNKMHITYHNFIQLFGVEYPFSKDCWKTSLQKVRPKYDSIQKKKQLFFEAIESYITGLLQLKKKPNNSELKKLDQNLLTNAKFTKIHCDKLKTADDQFLKNYLSTLKSFAGIDKESYKNLEKDDYKEKIFEILELKDL